MEKTQITILFREESRNPGHTVVSVFVGYQRGSRGCAGTLTFRTDEWDDICAEIEASKATRKTDQLFNFAADAIDVKRG